MKVLIIEDEAPAYRRLSKLVKECDSAAEVVGIVQSVKEGIEWFASNSMPDLILSDIQLADDLSFNIFKQLNINTPVIFTTAFDEYAINAFKFYSIDYLLKPIDATELKRSIDKFKQIQKTTQPVNFEDILKSLVKKEYRERFLVYQKDSLIPVVSTEIAYFESADGATMLITKTNKRYFVNETLDQLEEDMNPKQFFRVNRQILASAQAIDKIFNFGQQKLKINLAPASENEIIVSKLKASSFKDWLNG